MIFLKYHVYFTGCKGALGTKIADVRFRGDVSFAVKPYTYVSRRGEILHAYYYIQGCRVAHTASREDAANDDGIGQIA